MRHKKKFKVRWNSSRNCSIWVLITFDGMESSFARFNHVCFNFGVESLEQSVKLDRLVIFISALAIPFSNTTFSKPTTKKQCFLQCFRCKNCFPAAVVLLHWWKKTYFKRRPLFRSQIFSVAERYDVQGSHLIGCLWVSLIIEQSECLVCYFLCTELTLFSIELFENCIYLNCVIF